MSWHHYDRPGHTPLWTRNPAPPGAGGTLRPILNLPHQHRRRYRAIHEAGHATLFAESGIPFHWVEVDHSGGQVMTADGPRDLGAQLVGVAAGERAADRWLHENGLWTPWRGWATEVAGIDDRDHIRQRIRTHLGAELTYGTQADPARDLEALQAVADRELDRLWPRVLCLAHALDEHGQLTYAQAVEAAAIPCGR
jgi:hypothetical protein